MAGLVPAIHVFLRAMRKDVDARHKAGHDDCESRERGRLRTESVAFPLSCPRLSRASRLGGQGLASLSEMAGTSPAMTAEKYRLPQRHRRVPLVTSPRGPNLGKTGDSG
jgi:hypothetical protein